MDAFTIETEYGSGRIYSHEPILNGTDMVTYEEFISILFTYPLSNSVMFTSYKRGGFTREDFFDAIRSGYKNIYHDEDEATTCEEKNPFLFNRGSTDGPYGIWGHDLEDLYIEGITKSDKGYYELTVGS